MNNDYKILDLDNYYRKKIYQHFTKDCKSSVSITNEIDVTRLVDRSKQTNTKFYINFLYCLAKVLNSRDDYKMVYDYGSNKVVIYNKINVTHYVFDKNTETCTPVYTEFDLNYANFYKNCMQDIERAKETGGYQLDEKNHLNYFDASYISWISYQSLNIELPDGYLYYQPIINWGRYKEQNEKLKMPVTVRMNHAVADGYLVAKVFLLLQEEIERF